MFVQISCSMFVFFVFSLLAPNTGSINEFKQRVSANNKEYINGV